VTGPDRAPGEDSPVAIGAGSRDGPDAPDDDRPGPAPSLLEQRYRTCLRVLPAEYRDRWEDEMVATFLATACAGDPDFADYGRPPVAEVASVLGLAVRLRLGGMPTQRSREWGAAARYVALTGLLVNASLAVWGLLPLAVYLLTGGFEVRPEPGSPDRVSFASTGYDPAVVQLWPRLIDQGVGILWIAAYFALVLGHHRTARRLGVLALVPGFLMIGFNLVAGLFGLPANRTTLTSVLVLVVLAVPLAATMAFGPDAPPLERRPWLRAGVAGLLLSLVFEVMTVGLLLLGQAPTLAYVLDWIALCSAVLVVAAVVGSGRRVADRRGWELALLVLAGLLFVVRLTTAVAYLPPLTNPDNAVLPWVQLVELLALGAVGAAQVVALRRSAPQPAAQP
jgi:hypothetical protein